MEKIYSKIEPGNLLHVVGNIDVTTEQEALQMAIIKGNTGKRFEAHKHLEVKKENNITQESIIVIAGVLKAVFYDLDDTILQEVELLPSDYCMTFRGGHFFEMIEDGTKVFEFKNGPYLGQSNDKAWIK